MKLFLVENKYTKFQKIARNALLGIFLSGVMFGCKAQYYNQAQLNVDQTMQEMRDQKRAENVPVVQDNPGYYASTKAHELAGPAWLDKPVNLRAKNMPFELLVIQALGSEQIVPNYDVGVVSNQPLSLTYTGTVKGALNMLAAKTGYSYKVQGSRLNWSAFETHTFNISFMPGTAAYSVGQQQSGGGSSSSSSGSSSGSNSNPNMNALQDDQYSTLEGNLSVWKDLHATLEQLKSPKGKVVVSESTTTVTVSDYPSNVSAMATYIKQLNKVLNQQVLISVQVLEVELDKSFSFGVDWSLVGKVLGEQYSLTANLASSSNVDSSNTGIAMFQLGGNNNALLKALSQQGRVRIVTRPSVITMNNQIASIRITQETGYLQSVNTTVNQISTQTALQPSSVTDGFTLYLLPKIQNNSIYLQITSTIASLVSLDSVSSAPAGADVSASGSTYQAIQVPKLAQKEFNQRSRVESGSTLVVAGYKRLSDQTEQDDLYGVSSLGGKGALSKNVETLVLITPSILKGNH